MFKRRRSKGTPPDDAWLAWPTMAEARQSWPAVGSNVRADDVKAAIAKWGRLVMVRYQVETHGRYEGRAVRCWVGKFQVGTVEASLEEEFRLFIKSMAADGLPATARARFDRSPSGPRLWMVGAPERRPGNAPFLPPLTETNVEFDQGQSVRLEALFANTAAERKTLQKVGSLTNADGRTWLQLDGIVSGALVGTTRDYVGQVLDAGLPATCSVTIKKRAQHSLVVTVDVPDDRESTSDADASPGPSPTSDRR